MPKLLFTVFLLFLFNTFIQAQQPEQKTFNQTNATPYDHITMLKEGVLLVRLKSAKNKIDALNKMGKPGWAKKIEREQKAENKELIEAFTKYYTFSPVYFFYSENSDKILAQEFDSVVLNSNLEPAFRNGAFLGKFLVAEIGLIGQGHSQFNAKGERKDEISQNSTIEGLIISDQNLVQLSDPFPYFVRSFNSLGEDLSRSEAKMVEKLNTKLIEFSKIQPTALKTVNYNGKREALNEEKVNTGRINIIARIFLGIAHVITTIF